MRNLFVLPVLLLAVIPAISFSQTKEIAHKSHSGGPQPIDLSVVDNFGNPEPPRLIDTIIRIEDSLFIEIGTQGFEPSRFRDTIQNHWLLHNTEYHKHITDNNTPTRYIDRRPGIKKEQKKSKGSWLPFAFPAPPSTPTALILILASIFGLTVWFTYRQKPTFQ